ncbi:hypothetical protein [Nocardia africana]|uniref:Uncharacterized protein n=1 Tax=Nocardia africana TaxID=134964 RepID=A0ABW6NN71_9NOCA
MFYAAHHLDAGSGTIRIIYGFGADRSLPSVSPEQVARRLADVPLPHVTKEVMAGA